MSVGEVCNREVVFAERETPISEAAGLMRSHHVGDLVVVEPDGGRRWPVGIVSDRDIVIELVAQNLALDSVVVKDIMSTDVLVLGESEDWLDATTRMADRGVRRAPVVDVDGALVGILAVDDVIELVAEQLTRLTRLMGKERARERRTRERP